MEETQTENNEPKMRVNVKKNFKGEVGLEYTARGDTKEEVQKNLLAARELAKAEAQEVLK